MAVNTVSFKATSKGLVIILDNNVNFNEIVEGIEKKLVSSGNFFKGAVLDITYRNRELSEDEENALISMIEKKAEAQINSFKKEVVEQKSIAFDKKINIKKIMYFNGTSEGITKFHNGTLRSGQLIKYEGNVVVIGDVNPGGEIQAAGNIIVLGSVRGTVHAGYDGNRNAVIAALNLAPTQLRIADVITRSPDEMEGNQAAVPEIARIKDEYILIDELNI